MTEEQRKEFDSMRGAAHVFNDSAVLLQDVIVGMLAPAVLEKGKELRGSIIASVILYAFSSELGLKALFLKAGMPIPHKHDLKSLFGSLPNDMQENIKTQINQEGFEDDFDTLIDRNKDAFIEWRYYYEGGDKKVNITFLRKLSLAIDKECNR